MKGTNMLWQFSPKSLESDIRSGLAYFEKKYLSAPNVIYINPQYGLGVLDGVKVVGTSIVTPCHVYIGKEE